MPPDVAALGQAVKQRREELLLSQVDVWQAGGPSNTTLTKIENGDGNAVISRKTLERLDEGLQWEKGSAYRVLMGIGPAVEKPLGLFPELDASGAAVFEVVNRLRSQGSPPATRTSDEAVVHIVRALLEVALQNGADGRTDVALEVVRQAYQVLSKHIHGVAIDAAQTERYLNERSSNTRAGGTGAAEEISTNEFEAAMRRRRAVDEPDDMDPAEFPLGAAARRGDVEPGEQDRYNDSEPENH